MIGEQPDLHRPRVQVRGLELLDAVPDDRPRDRDRIALIRLAALALPLARGSHQLRRHAHDPLARRHQRLLQPGGHMPAVLDRPHPILIQRAPPANRHQMPALVCLDPPAAANTARSRVDRGERMVALVRIHADHDHMHRPFTWLYADEADLRRTYLCRGECQAPIKSRR